MRWKWPYITRSGDSRNRNQPTDFAEEALTHTMVLQTIRRTIGILTMRTTILPRQIPADGPRPTRTDLQDAGDPRYREARPTRPTQTATSRPLHRVRRFAPLTG